MQKKPEPGKRSMFDDLFTEKICSRRPLVSVLIDRSDGLPLFSEEKIHKDFLCKLICVSGLILLRDLIDLWWTDWLYWFLELVNGWLYWSVWFYKSWFDLWRTVWISWLLNLWLIKVLMTALIVWMVLWNSWSDWLMEPGIEQWWWDCFIDKLDQLIAVLMNWLKTITYWLIDCGW